MSGGAALPVEVLRGFEAAFGCIILEGYGLSETSPVASFNHPDRDRKPGSIGTPIEGVELRLVGLPTASDVAAGEVGEIAVRGHNLMKGYWGREEATREAIPDGWFRTGDLARQDHDGYFFIVDRKKDLIIRGGYNVYPREVEEVLYEHPAVAEAAVVGIPHPTHGGGGRRRRGPQARGRGHPGGAAGLLPGAGRGLQVPTARVAGGGAAQDGHRQAAAPRGGPARGPGAVSGQPPPTRPRRWTCCWPRPRSGRPAGSCPGAPGLRFAAGLARRPDRLAQRATALAGELARVGVGRSTLAPAPGDRRFTDPAWTANPLLRRLVQAHLAAGRTAEGLVADADLEWRDGERMRLLVENLVQALAPSNLPLASPAFWKALADLGRRQPGPRRPAPGRRPGHAATGAVDGDRPTRSRWAPTWR